jgi:predicted porin
LGYEGDLVSSGALQTIDRALIFSARDPFGGGYGDVRDTGIQLRGTFSNQFDYRLGLFNGLGERQNQLAASDAKAIVARLAYRPTGVPGLTVGVSAARNNTRTDFTPSARRADRDAFNVFGAYKRDNLTLQAEYLDGSASGFSSASLIPTVRDIKGYYGSVGYLFTPKIEGVFRYDYLDTNKDGAGDTDVRDLILGLNYYIKGNNAKIQANLIRRNGAPQGFCLRPATPMATTVLIAPNFVFRVRSRSKLLI